MKKEYTIGKGTLVKHFASASSSTALYYTVVIDGQESKHYYKIGNAMRLL